MAIVKLYANLRKLAETKELSVIGGTVGAVVSELVRLKPPVGGIVLENGRLAPHVVVTLNGLNVTDFKTPVVEQDIVAIFPPMAGG
jgi:MoaD family protein